MKSEMFITGFRTDHKILITHLVVNYYAYITIPSIFIYQVYVKFYYPVYFKKFI